MKSRNLCVLLILLLALSACSGEAEKSFELTEIDCSPLLAENNAAIKILNISESKLVAVQYDLSAPAFLGWDETA